MDIIFLELILVTAVALGLGIWQLWDVNKALEEEDDSETSRPDETTDD